MDTENKTPTSDETLTAQASDTCTPTAAEKTAEEVVDLVQLLGKVTDQKGFQNYLEAALELGRSIRPKDSDTAQQSQDAHNSAKENIQSMITGGFESFSDAETSLATANLLAVVTALNNPVGDDTGNYSGYFGAAGHATLTDQQLADLALVHHLLAHAINAKANKQDEKALTKDTTLSQLIAATPANQSQQKETEAPSSSLLSNALSFLSLPFMVAWGSLTMIPQLGKRWFARTFPNAAEKASTLLASIRAKFASKTETKSENLKTAETLFGWASNALNNYKSRNQKIAYYGLILFVLIYALGYAMIIGNAFFGILGKTGGQLMGIFGIGFALMFAFDVLLEKGIKAIQTWRIRGKNKALTQKDADLRMQISRFFALIAIGVGCGLLVSTGFGSLLLPFLIGVGCYFTGSISFEVGTIIGWKVLNNWLFKGNFLQYRTPENHLKSFPTAHKVIFAGLTVSTLAASIAFGAMTYGGMLLVLSSLGCPPLAAAIVGVVVAGMTALSIFVMTTNAIHDILGNENAFAQFKSFIKSCFNVDKAKASNPKLQTLKRAAKRAFVAVSLLGALTLSFIGLWFVMYGGHTVLSHYFHAIPNLGADEGALVVAQVGVFSQLVLLLQAGWGLVKTLAEKVFDASPESKKAPGEKFSAWAFKILKNSPILLLRGIVNTVLIGLFLMKPLINVVMNALLPLFGSTFKDPAANPLINRMGGIGWMPKILSAVSGGTNSMFFWLVGALFNISNARRVRRTTAVNAKLLAGELTPENAKKTSPSPERSGEKGIEMTSQSGTTAASAKINTGDKPVVDLLNHLTPATTFFQKGELTGVSKTHINPAPVITPKGEFNAPAA